MPSSTIKHHIKAPWRWEGKSQAYYFCDDPECDVVYFGLDNSVIERSALRTTVGIKERTDHSLVCYCFGITWKEARDNLEAKDFVMDETEKQTCACSSRNPSGRCCLKDFPRS
ncbi:MAG: hypothetical protein KZQ85_12155 [Candidatus Thiodiazotropha sp. (ex Myrtea sp. 'scaly one' KF741663)]|nr:hypothetical protein [Candidatus Thiodiazotropha sp. (ex Myrtea sp. 'scaly one' KF741663)]